MDCSLSPETDFPPPKPTAEGTFTPLLSLTSKDFNEEPLDFSSSPETPSSQNSFCCVLQSSLASGESFVFCFVCCVFQLCFCCCLHAAIFSVGRLARGCFDSTVSKFVIEVFPYVLLWLSFEVWY
ncbi:hypothetical protein V6N13_055753 [Hibiscus sabdariffa]|uniref:Uncharacterized protein n=1 Tax=Hibiscus sabdariffa TaxID=183260 RepID=A0ABR2BMC8_9ROSI